jgi:hypothetical protein
VHGTGHGIIRRPAPSGPVFSVTWKNCAIRKAEPKIAVYSRMPLALPAAPGHAVARR